MNVAGIDIGYGWTKMASREKNILFRTQVAKSLSQMDRSFQSYPNEVIVDNESFIVGAEASFSSQINKDFLCSKEYFAIIGYCLSCLQENPGSVDAIGLGLPPQLFTHKKVKQIQTALKEVSIKTRFNYIQIPEHVFIIPQGVGAYFAWLQENPDKQNLNIFIMDIGFYTLDLVFINKGKYQAGFSKSYSFGIEQLLEKTRDYFSFSYGELISSNIADEILRTGRFTHMGKEYKLNTDFLIYDFYIPELIKILKNYSSYLKDNNFTVDHALLCGGGAAYISSAVESVEVIKNPQWANARGYMLYSEAEAK